MDQETAKKIINKTISDYSKIAADFDRTRSKYAWPILWKFAEFVKPGDNILDFGCGNGRLLDVLNIENIVYKGVDPVGNLIDIARQKYQDVTAFDQSARGLAVKTKRSIEFKTFEFNVENFKLDFPDKYFDKIFAIAVFHHIPSDKLRQNVLRELKRVLKDDGLIFLTVWNLWKGKGFQGVLEFLLRRFFGKIITDKASIKDKDLDFGDMFIDYETADKKIKVQRYHHAFTKRELKRLAQDAGLKAEKVFYDNNKFNLCAILTRCKYTNVCESTNNTNLIH